MTARECRRVLQDQQRDATMGSKGQVGQHGNRMTARKPKRKHQHYVPLHYLRQFSTNKKNVNLYNVAGNFCVRASIKTQCREKYFYGDDDRWERWLGTIEDRCARTLRRLTTTATVPPRYSEDCTRARMWTAVQKVRTALHADQLAAMLNTADRVLYPNQAAAEWATRRDLRLGTTRSQAIRQSLTFAKLVFETIQDLQLSVLQADASEFWTSDNPVQEYNIFGEKDNVRNGLGAGRSGSAAIRSFVCE